MEFLSWLFFCLSPFALFCTEDGTGLIMCPIFILLGILFKFGAGCCNENVGNNGVPRAIVKVESQDFWEWHYKNRMNGTLADKSVGDYLMSARDKEARDWATTMCRYHNAWVPPEAMQEKIARKNGVITETMIKEREIKKDRIQIGKYYLMNELKVKYENIDRYAEKEIKKDMKYIELTRHKGADDWYTERAYGKTVKEMWASLSPNEREQAKKWIEEYEEKLNQSIQDYKTKVTLSVRQVRIDF